jgi:hypothetical protein
VSLFLWHGKFAYGQQSVPDTESSRVYPIRAAYFHLAPVEQGDEYFHQLKTHGFNTALVAGPYHLEESLWQAWGHLAQTRDIALFPVLQFSVPQEFTEGRRSYIPYINRDGEVYQATPCPLDRRYWDRVIGERFDTLAVIAETTTIAGALFDTEMYGSDISLYTDLCYCDGCWQQFIRSQPWFTLSPVNRSYPVLFLPRSQRFDYLTTHQLFRDYTIFQWQQLQQIVSHIATSAQRISPHFQVGFLGYLHNWFFSALVYGLGTPESPVLVFSESS